jgi:hypothetical protein
LRKATSILLLVLLLYNMLGYQVLFFIRTQALQKEINSTIDKGQIDESKLLVFKVPVPIYHQVDKGFERVEGSLQWEGRFYEKVKSKLENDTIHIYCLPNEQKQELVNKLNDHIQTHVVDLKTPKHSKPEKPLPTLLKEYLPLSYDHLPLLEGRLADAATQRPCLIHFSSPVLQSSTPPPEAA